MPDQNFTTIAKEFKGEPADLVPLLQKVQTTYGYISKDSVRNISRWLRITENDLYGVATFFTQFRFTKPAKHTIKVCLGTACHVKGGEQILDVLKRRLSIEPGEATTDEEYQLERVACLGCCALAPVVTMDTKIFGETSVLKVGEMLDEHGKNL